MLLTERQCWKVIRDLVVDKNKEYSYFLLKMLDANQTKELQGYTRDTFLSNFDFYSLDDFYDYAKDKNNGKESNTRWLENLSSEDLILFLDFRCRILQFAYEFYKNNQAITKNNIRDIVKSTKISKLSGYNAGRLRCGSKPMRVEGEIKNSQLPYTQSQLREQALSQVISSMANKLVSRKNITIEQAQQIVSKLRTSNTNLLGERTGYKLVGPIQIDEPKTNNSTPTLKSKNERKDSGMRFIGYDEQGGHIFMLNGKKVNFFKEPIPEAILAYDTNKNPINNEYQEKPQFVGFDIQGTPVYQYEDAYYTSTGRRLEDDEYIDTNCEDSEFKR